jgi:leucyl-tRNA synthetase
MSKSKRNGVDPQELIETYGADTARFFMMFASPPEQTLEWSDSGVEGAYRFLKRVWAFGFAIQEQAEGRHAGNAGGSTGGPAARNPPAAEAGQLRPRQAAVQHRGLRGDEDAQCAGKGQQGERGRKPCASVAEGFSILLRILSPIAPHICHALWCELGYGSDILAAPWPEPVEAALAQDEEELVLQVNGKHRGSIRVKVGADKTAIEAVALASESAQKFMEGKPAKKVVVVPGRLVNIVV